MKPADQIKVIALALMTIVLMIGVISYVSMKTTAAMANHGAGHAAAEHGEAASEHGEAAAEHGDAKMAEHGTEGKMAEHGDAKPADGKMAEHGDAKMADGKMAEHGDAKMADGKMAEHGDAKMADGKMAEHGTEGKMAEHAAETKPAEHAAAGGDIEAGSKVFMGKGGCAACHTVTSVKAMGTIGPKLDGLGKTAATRVAGKSAEDYIKESIENPSAFVVPKYTAGLMPANLKSMMSEQEFKDLVAFLGSL